MAASGLISSARRPNNSDHQHMKWEKLYTLNVMIKKDIPGGHVNLTIARASSCHRPRFHQWRCSPSGSNCSNNPKSHGCLRNRTTNNQRSHHSISPLGATQC
eukprot:3178745-Ditylum_brightwellii.AAC.2